MRRTIKVEVEIEYEYNPEEKKLRGMDESYLDAVAKDLAIRPAEWEEDGVRLITVCNREEDSWWMIGRHT